MSLDTSWATVAVLLWGCFAIALLAIIGAQLGAGVRVLANAGPCPATGREVHRLILADRYDGHWTDVVECSGVASPENATCNKACLSRMRQARAKAIPA